MKVYTYFRWLSLDIVLGAIFFLLYLARLYDLDIHVAVYIELAIAIWLIYLIDHLIDSTKNTAFFSSRHSFYRSQTMLIKWLILLLTLGAAVSLMWLPIPVLKNGLILSAFSIGYLVLVYFKPDFWIKELLVSIGYAMGVFLAPISLKSSFLNFDFLFILSVAVVALINLMIFSIYEIETDEKDNFPSLVRRLGHRNAKILTYTLIGLSILLCLPLGFYHIATAFLMFAMATVLWALLIFQDRFATNQWYRVIGDGIFYLPILFIPFA